MRQIIAFLLSLAVAVLVTAAGFYFDKATLAYFGFALVGLVLILWLHEWGKQRPALTDTAPAEAESLHPDKDAERADQRHRARVLDQIGRTAHNVGFALGEGDAGGMHRAVAGLHATLLTMRKEYGLEIPEVRGGVSAERSLRAGANYLTIVGEMLSQGHLEEARASAAEFVPVFNLYIAGERRTL